MILHKFKLNLFLITILLFASCQNESLQDDLDSVEQTLTKDARATMDFLIDQGYSSNDLIPNFQNKTFIYAGDMEFSFDLIKNLKKNRIIEESSVEKNQWYFVGNGVYYENSRNITYYIERNFPRSLEYEFSWAAYHWSRISPNINIRRTYTRSQADILVGTWYSTSDGAWARAALPSGNGNVGSWLNINTAKDHEGASSESTMALLIHELGHNLGYLHSDQTEGGLIPGTRGPAYHAANNCGSVMKSSVYVCNWRISSTPGWSSDDRIAIDWAYDLY
ncbi:M57 family metalloprotease [Aquimarina gracilis]|uniref:M57 family metalloprotease n=1 Tax=Aquimarina gracilis TaxID=874422 RepID=A0ABU5ZUY4_9FLAO|nr:M57 family metalloprotease [Aquimarina gracilis]MEB3345870.1 M57 family metalloprotease [Aquimarina gracilis]